MASPRFEVGVREEFDFRVSHRYRQAGIRIPP